jgi:hypothetical protein
MIHFYNFKLLFVCQRHQSSKYLVLGMYSASNSSILVSSSFLLREQTKEGIRMTQSQFDGYYHPGVQSDKPLYIYRDESLSALWQGDPVAGQRRQQFLWQRFLVKLSFAVLTIGWAVILPVHYGAVYNAYQQGRCTLTDKQVQEYDSKDKFGHITSRSYAPVFSYEVQTANGRQAFASGFDGPSSVQYTDFADAQAITDRYAIDQTTPCWYNPSNPSHAFIVFYGYQSSDALATFFWNILGFGIFAIIVYLLFDWFVWRLYTLARRGVLTQGKVLRHEERRSRSRRYTVSIIGFHAAEEAAKERYITGNASLLIGNQVQVCYDPFYPHYRRLYDWPAMDDYITRGAFVVLLLILALMGMLILWLLP